MANKLIIFITGANTGLGYEIVRSLYKSSPAYEILIGSRKVENGEAAIKSLKEEVPKSSSSLSVIQADVSSDDSIKAACDTISSRFGKLDVLINNAGAGFDRQIQDGSLSIREAFNQSWDTNVSGTQVLTTMCIPLLLKSSDPRLMFLTSGTSSLAETERQDGPMFSRLNNPLAAGWPKDEGINPITSYRSTKAGLNMLMREWCKTLGNDGVKIWAISPGFLATGLAGVGAEQLKKVRLSGYMTLRCKRANARQMGALDPSEGGNFIRDVVQGKHDHEQGKVIRATMVQPY